MYGLRTLVRDHPADRWRAVVTFGHDAAHERLTVRKVEISSTAGGILDVASWRSFPIARVESQANVAHYYRLMLAHEHTPTPPSDPTIPVEQRRPLKVGQPKPRPPGMTHWPDAHYQLVADVYTFFVEHGHHPAKRMADEWGYPVSTIYRWIKEARARDLIPPARTRGRAG